MKGKTRVLFNQAKRCVADAKLVKNGGTRGMKPAQKREAKERGLNIIDELYRRAGRLRDPEAARMVRDNSLAACLRSLRKDSVATTTD